MQTFMETYERIKNLFAVDMFERPETKIIW